MRLLILLHLIYNTAETEAKLLYEHQSDQPIIICYIVYIIMIYVYSGQYAIAFV